MKLLSINCEGLPGYQTFHFEDLGKVNVLVGPNGTGKTTALRVLYFALKILSYRTIKDFISPDLPDWEVFSCATLTFSVTDEDVPDSVFFDGRSDVLEFVITCSNGVYTIESITYGEKVGFSTQSTKHELQNISNSIVVSEKELSDAQTRLNSSNDANVRQRTHSLISDITTNIKLVKDKFDEASTVELFMTNGGGHISRSEVDSFLGGLKLLEVFFVNPNKAIEDSIPDLINNLCALKSGRTAQNKQFRKAESDLQYLLQHKVDFFEEDTKKHLIVNGVDYRLASSGTQVSLAYFGLTGALSDAAFVIWDEPENGLHPTRRIRILDLIKNDKRTFFLATHALEFAPLFYDKGRVFRCDYEYLEDAAAPSLSINKVTTRGDAFRLLEALGVQPARTLFTANVIVWVEGPTELIFYRHWLAQYFSKHAPEIEEGFHYTIMHYGGGLISYLDVMDDQDLLRVSALYDLLSLCRHPIIIVDSDFRVEPKKGEELTALKPSAKKIYDQVQRLNEDRAGAALFCYTGGREVENYFPDDAIWHAVTHCWKSSAKHSDTLSGTPFKLKRYDAFHEAINAYLLDLGLVDQKSAASENGKPAALGRTQWGASNKVEMTRMALSYQKLSIGSMRWGFEDELEKIANFIIDRALTGRDV